MSPDTELERNSDTGIEPATLDMAYRHLSCYEHNQAVVPDEDDLPELIPACVDAPDIQVKVSRPHFRPSAATLVFARASDIQPVSINWLWPQRIAIGKHTLLGGEPGVGKSQLTCWIAATVTVGGLWPCNGGTAPKGSVVILSAEDDVADTIRPRLDAARADVTKVFLVSAVRVTTDGGHRTFNLQADLQLLEKLVLEIGDVRLVIIDPISSYLGKVDSHRNAEVRSVLEPIGDFASRLSTAVISVTHLNKVGAGDANTRFIGSIAFVAQARAAFVVARDSGDKEQRLLIPTKNSVGPESKGLAFRIDEVEIAGGMRAPLIAWGDSPINMSAEEVFATGNPTKPSALNVAEDFLREILDGGPVPSKIVEREAQEAGVSWRTVRRAKKRVGLTTTKAGPAGEWVWSLDNRAHQPGHL